MDRLPTLLEKLRKKTCSPAELAELKQLLAEEQGSRFAQWLDQDLAKAAAGADSEAGRKIWAQVARALPTEPKPRVARLLRRPYHTLAAAAAIALLLVAGYFLFMHPPAAPMLVATNATGQPPLLVELPDATQVWLNADSELRYPEAFTATERRVELEGQAFFAVTHQAERPFHVTSGELTTTVLGTTFDIKAFPADTALTVALYTGRVRVSQAGEQSWTLAPEQQLTYRAGGQARVEAFDPNLHAIWRTDTLKFDETPVGEVLRILRIHMDDHTINVAQPALLEETISGTFAKSDGLTTILELICFSKGWTLEQSSDTEFLISE